MENHRTIVLHYGELCLKGKNRGMFEDQVARNIRFALGRDAEVLKLRKLFGRLCVDLPQGFDAQFAMQKLQRVFGLSNMALAVKTEFTLEAIWKTCESLLPSESPTSFCVRTKRADKRFPMKSEELSREIGARVVETKGWKVDLKHPALELSIELQNGEAYVSTERLQAAGGLPLASAGKLACLLSGGIDSPLASFRMMRRGCEPFFIHFHSAPFTSRASVEKVLDLAEIVCRDRCKAEIAIVPFGEIQQAIIKASAEEYRVLLYRRFMLRIAEKLAQQKRALALVSGEVLSQVASQTLSNLAHIEEVISMPMLRPLIGMDKQEIIDEAKKIGTYDTSCEPHDDCCSYLMPDKPATKTRPGELQRAEAKLNIEALVAKGVTEAEIQVV
ncbi:MAG: tRNA 4-thiouridine(8) synthase ThiI [Deltaproteobacteria bacterium CG_4_10_14_0_2_um_filter_43_8]|nr:MAG: tRNA 4-thiouridine(8) synthase ThiI [Deltaproteobacteria bacterium CG11_big_fil_rev_8_21_14_0_20_42_23]PJA19765.1 MAG: tRNA 4-thiouridine(8) synthase ThiI [Deltaproteobacteria bacterium CG_4_10_14_0_2_um_filter_43_8]PJC64192.1 MAG: tRNA 4-thiouridine(8) synthase ThiI [Deltaproteobacteria bacterium CG_4_9_14_0_2_um_filter_42_21]